MRIATFFLPRDVVTISEAPSASGAVYQLIMGIDVYIHEGATSYKLQVLRIVNGDCRYIAGNMLPDSPVSTEVAERGCQVNRRR